MESLVEGQDDTAEVADGRPAAPAPPEDLDHICLSGRAQAGDRDTCRRAVQRIAAVDAPDGDGAAAAAVERLNALEDRIACYHGADRPFRNLRAKSAVLENA